jgi:hypothetical protein
MAAKDIRNLILALIVLIIGMYAILYVLEFYIPATAVEIDILSVDSLQGIINGLSIAIGVIVILLVPVYAYKRSKEKG